jgi:signal transduction histidine kinase
MKTSSSRETTFRFPFDIDTRYFLVLAVVFFILSIKPINQYILSIPTIHDLKADVDADLKTKLDDFSNRFIKKTPQFSRSLNEQIKDGNEDIMSLPYDVFVFQDSVLTLWSTNKVLPPEVNPGMKQPFAYRDSMAIYAGIQHSYLDKGHLITVVGLIKVKNEPTLVNKYFPTNYNVGDSENDYNIKLSLTPVSGSVPIICGDKALFYMYKEENFLHIKDKNGWRLFLSALPFILFGVSIHTYFKVEVKRKGIVFIFSLLLLTALLMRLMGYLWGFPNDFEEFGLFSPDYFGTDIIHKSLGDLFINMCLLFWILLFFIINVQGKVYPLRKSKYKTFLGVLIFLVSIIGLNYLGELICCLSYDSVIHFDTTIFYKLDLYSFMGILTFMVIFVNFVYVSVITRNYLVVCFSNKYIKYILAGIACIICLLVDFGIGQLVYYVSLFGALSILFLLQDKDYLKTKFDFNSYKLLVWILLVSAFGAFFLTILIQQRELINRENVGRHVLQTRGSRLQTILQQKCEEMRSQIGHPEQRFGISDSITVAPEIWHPYFADLENRYEISLTLLPNVSNDSTYNNIETVNGALEYRYTLSKLDSLSQNVDVLIRLVKSNARIVNSYGDLLQAPSDLIENEDLYSYGLYIDSVLIDQHGKYDFPYKPNLSWLYDMNAGPVERHMNGNSELWLHDATGKKRIVLVKQQNTLYLFTTLFAYIFFIYFVTITLYILGNIIARSNLNYKRFRNLLSINLRLRIQFSILLVELCSFIVIGYSTSYFLVNRVNNKMQSDLSQYRFSLQQEVNTGNYFSDSSFMTPIVVKQLKDMSRRYSIHMNIFDVHEGKLLLSTFPEIFHNGLMSNRMDPEVYSRLKEGVPSHILREESIGDMSFFSSYFMLRSSRGQNLAMIQLPFFLTSSDIRTETTTVITTLINIYIFVFLISAIIAFFLTQSVTDPFSKIVKQFTKINLEKTNEPLPWSDNDEIGLLIKEYNRMLRKLENSTVLLAKTEREMAWREMAKQVAHEIKNPLTPMKLSMQQLERAIKSNASNVNEIAIRVTKTIVEQIDQLTHIATNFSNFAQLPASKREVFVLNEFLYSVTGMYHDDSNNEFLFMIPDYEIRLNADKSQIMRVFTNIIQNAIQAIPEDRKGNIALTVSKIKNNFVRITISDNGEGISDEKAKSLFQPYFTTKSSGTGLGLAMCKDIIEESGGKISFDSVENEGTDFHIDLPTYNENEKG